MLTELRNRPLGPTALVFLLLFGAHVGRAEVDLNGATVLQEESPQGALRPEPAAKRVFKDRISPHWFQQSTRFWYRNDLRRETTEFILVEAERGTRKPAFDHAKLASALSKAAGTEYRADRLPFNTFEFVDEARAIRFKAGDTTWKCSLSSYQISKIASDDEKGNNEADPMENDQRRSGPPPAQTETENSDLPPNTSLDGKWIAFSKEHNLFVKLRDHEAKELQLSGDGKEGLAYGRFSWSPDSTALIAFRIEPGERKEVYLLETSPKEGGRAKLKSRPYPLAGDKFSTYELNVFDLASLKQSKPEIDRFEHEWLAPQLRWSKDGHHAVYQQTDRGHQRFRLIEVDAHTGETRNIIDEKTKTFIWTAHAENLNLSLVNWLTNSDEIIYASESNGWRHLYLVDVTTGKLKNPITTGGWVVRGIDRIDENNRQVWFRASGVYPNQDPYLMHYGRVNLDGSGLTFLTASNGNHSLQYSPDRRFMLDTYSRVDLAPVSELRRAADGQLVCGLEHADISDLQASGWAPPEVFVAKGRDGETDIWGIICRPSEYDARRKYPILEDIYAGPQGSFVPKSFSSSSRYDALTKLGFIVVKMDGMGTANRSKAFHDVCWHNLKDAGFPDRILWIKAAAAKYPYLDITRVGIYGTSAGGQSAAGAVLFHPDFYKAAVANCGCHDNRMDKASWNEQWMGYPVGSQYSECSNIDNAARLRGRLFLIVGEMDSNVPPESTMRFADALIKAGKDFDLLVVPGANHGVGGSYMARRQADFFLRHLLGKEPPDRNRSSGGAD